MRALVFRSAYSASRNARASAAFAASIKAHCAVSSETLMLQVRCANPPMPHRTSSSSRSGVAVGLLSYLRAIPPFGALAFRSAYWLSPHHPALRRAGVPFGLLAAPNARTPVASRPTASPNARTPVASRSTASPNAELQSLRDLRQAQTLDLQVRFAHPPSTHRNAPSEHSGVPHGLLGSESTPCSLTPNAHAPGSLREPSDAAPNRLFKPFRCSGRLIFLISPSSECRLNRFKGSP